MQVIDLNTLENYTGCFLKIQPLFKDKKDEFKIEMQKNLAASANPYKMSLVGVKLSPNLYKCKTNSMAANILVELQHFINQEDNKDKFESCLSQELQKEAFQVAIRQKNSGLLKLMVKVYQLVNIREHLLPFVKDLQDKGHLKEVCTLATLLSLQPEFSTAELIVPLFLQDRLSLADDFLETSPSHKKEILIFIDNLIGKKITSVDLEKYNVKDLKKMRSSKQLCNIVARLLKRFTVDPSVCPHFQKHRATGGLRFLFYKYYVEKTIQKQTFCSLVDDALKEHPYLKITLMHLFIEYCDLAAALPYVAKLQLASQDIPKKIKDTMLHFPELLNQNQHQDHNLKHTQEEEMWDESSEEFYPLSIPFEKVFLIDTVDGLEKCTNDLLTSPLLGVDSEWKPTFGVGAQEQAALLQLATTTQVFLLDLISLQPVLKDCHWRPIGELFSDPQVTKLGYGIRGDFRVLDNLNAEIKKGLSSAKNVIDLDHTKGILLKEYPNIFSHSDSGLSHKGLSELVYRCFGLPLDKREQFSNWAARPLTKSQIMYAAIDARCLIDTHTYLSNHAQDLHIADWKNIKSNVIIKPEKKKKSLKQSDANQANAELKDVKMKGPNCAADIKFVCDTMVQGLAKQLRSCGIDTEVLDTGKSCDHCIKYYEREKRVVLTRGSSYTRLRKYIPAEYVYNVQSEAAKQQLVEIVVVFNIKVTLSDVFARCSKCNSDSYMCVPASVLITLSAKTYKGFWGKTVKDEWVECQGGCINLATGRSRSGVLIQVEPVPDSVLQSIEVFYICCQCGKCYWEGSHHSRIVSGRLKDIIEDDKLVNSADNRKILRQISEKEAEDEATVQAVDEPKMVTIPLSLNDSSASSDALSDTVN